MQGCFLHPGYTDFLSYFSYDERFPQSKRLQQCLLYARFAPHSNLYAHPLDFFPVIDNLTRKVIHIDFPSHYSNNSKLSSGTTAPPPLDAENFGLSRDRIAPPQMRHEYLPEMLHLNEKEGEQDVQGKKIREDLKPLHIAQPKSISFSMNGNEIEWQKWKFHVGTYLALVCETYISFH